jgi:hypothetical protein
LEYLIYAVASDFDLRKGIALTVVLIASMAVLRNVDVLKYESAKTRKV